MKKKILSLIIITMFLVIACKESTTEQTPDPINDKYYVIKDGASFVYSLSITDSSGMTVNGNRYMNFNGTANVDGTPYSIQIDSFETIIPFDTITNSSISYIYQTNLGVYTYADTTGFTWFLPNEYKPYLSVDRESRLLFYPVKDGQSFPVFTLKYTYLIAGISVIDVDARVQSFEVLNININDSLSQLSASRIKYDFILRTSSTDSLYYSAYGWVVKDLGFVKWEGDSEVFNFLFNENIFPPSTTINMILKEYQL